MSPTGVGARASSESPEVGTIDMKLEVVTLPVSDVDRAKSFVSERRSHLTYASFNDPDGYGWLLQQVTMADVKDIVVPVRSSP